MPVWSPVMAQGRHHERPPCVSPSLEAAEWCQRWLPERTQPLDDMSSWQRPQVIASLGLEADIQFADVVKQSERAQSRAICCCQRASCQAPKALRPDGEREQSLAHGCHVCAMIDEWMPAHRRLTGARPTELAPERSWSTLHDAYRVPRSPTRSVTVTRYIRVQRSSASGRTPTAVRVLLAVHLALRERQPWLRNAVTGATRASPSAFAFEKFAEATHAGKRTAPFSTTGVVVQRWWRSSANPSRAMS